jgi:phosphatidylglycerol:prolipoprotein diacylglycerol transferase
VLRSAAITVGVDPEFELGPVSLSWHGVAIAVGIAAGAVVASRYGRRYRLDPEQLATVLFLMVVAGIVGARLFFLLVNDPGDILRPGDWLGSRGFAFYGGLIFGVLAAAVYIWRRELSVRYLDALAAGFPLGMAIGRVGDVVNGEHYGPPTDAPWAFRYTHPDAEVPALGVAYHSGGFYEIVLALAILAIVWLLRARLRSPGALLSTTVLLYGAGRFLMFFYRDDSDVQAFGLNDGQWTSLAVVGAGLCGLLLAARRPPAPRARSLA